MKSKIVFGMAVKNESNTLEASVESVRHLVDDIFISVDETSDEATMLKARALTKNVYRHSFTSKEKPFGSFCDLRNAMIKHAEALEADWFTWLDGHERYIYNQGFNFRQLIDDHPNSDVFMLPLDNVGVLTPQARLWRCGIGVHWIYDFHNKIWGYREDRISFIPSGCIVLHERDKQAEEHRKIRDNQRFECCKNYFNEILKNNPSDSRSWYYLGNTFGHEGYDKEAYDAYMKGYAIETWVPMKWQEGYYAASALYKLEKFDECRKLCMELNELQKRSEVFMLLGQISEIRGDVDGAIMWYTNASRCSMPNHEAYIVIEKSAFEYEPHAALADLYSKTDEMKALIQVKEALKYKDIPSNIMESLNKIRAEIKGSDTRPKILVLNSLKGYKIDFLPTLVEKVEKELDFTVVSGYSEAEGLLGEADTIFVEWCDENAVNISREKRAQKVVVRLHGYEAFGHVANVNWDNVDDVIFVSEHTLLQARINHPRLRQHVIPNGIDLDKFKIYPAKKTGYNVAFVGSLNSKKNLPLLLYIMMELPKEYILHVAGDWQEPHLAVWWYNFINENNLRSRVVMHGHRWDINRWLGEEIDYLISPSVTESFGVSIAEAMACGVMPIIHRRPGVAKLWPEECIFDTADEAALKIIQKPIDPRVLRQWIKDRYDLNIVAKKVSAILYG